MRPRVHSTGQRASGPHREVSTTRARRYFLRCPTASLAFVAVSAIVICTPGPGHGAHDPQHAHRRAANRRSRPQAESRSVRPSGRSPRARASSRSSRASEPRVPGTQARRRRLPRLPRDGSSLWAAVATSARTSDGSAAHTPLSAAAAPCARARSATSATPKMAVFFASLLPQFAPEGAGVVRGLARARPPLLLADVRLAGAATPSPSPGARSTSLPGTARRVLDAVTGVVLVALGLRLATEDR